ncbi:MAG: SH3 domain-containing protein [Alphaproteobacteria bacterium]
MLFRSLSVPLGIFVIMVFVMSAPRPVTAQQAANPTARTENPSGLPIPRWVSIRAKEANLRTGPGARYPIDWVLQRRSLPAEVVGEFENWRQIKVQDGTVGWVHKSMLSGKRMATVTAARVRVLQAPGGDAPVAAFVEDGVIVALDGCEATWCRIAIASHGVEGWIARSALWGIYDGETVKR